MLAINFNSDTTPIAAGPANQIFWEGHCRPLPPHNAPPRAAVEHLTVEASTTAAAEVILVICDVQYISTAAIGAWSAMDTYVNSLSPLHQLGEQRNALDETFSATSAFRVVSKTSEGKLAECVTLLSRKVSRLTGCMAFLM